MRPCTPLFRFFAISTLSDPVTFTDDRYRRDPPKVTTLYGLEMPTSRRNVVRYDDGTGDELEVPLGGTACKYLYASSTSEHLESILLTHFAPLVVVSGKVMFDLLPPEYKSLAVRMRVKYMPHPYIAIGTAKSRPTGLGMESDGLEVPFEDLPPWEEKHVKTFPVCWKNPVTGNLHVQVHPSGIHELVRRDLFSIHADRTRTPEKKNSSPSPVSQLIDALPPTAPRTESTLFPDGAHITDLKEARDLLYKLQRPGIAPEHVYVVDWKPRQLALFHNRGCLHSITGAFAVRSARNFFRV